MAFASRLPPLPARDFAVRRAIENKPGIHLIFDTPLRVSGGIFPRSVFDGLSVRFLGYSEKSPVRFRVVVKRYEAAFPYVELGYFNDDSSYGDHIVFKTQMKKVGDPNYQKRTMSGYTIPGINEYVWVGYNFTGTKKTQFYYNEHLLGEHEEIEFSQYEGFVIWSGIEYNNLTMLEIHITYDDTATSSIFHLRFIVTYASPVAFSIPRSFADNTLSSCPFAASRGKPIIAVRRGGLRMRHQWKLLRAPPHNVIASSIDGCSVDALVDTGAATSVMAMDLCTRLRKVKTPNG
ncbi:uncharacterized protein LOC135370501 [Ornithodoros turicata]|uniref:uncharacterized protein LOC135370501 n=1 Tax=Ornithodoros turicata TaxID=34597 RepID=UPI003138A2F8